MTEMQQPVIMYSNPILMLAQIYSWSTLHKVAFYDVVGQRRLVRDCWPRAGNGTVFSDTESGIYDHLKTMV